MLDSENQRILKTILMLIIVMIILDIATDIVDEKQQVENNEVNIYSNEKGDE